MAKNKQTKKVNLHKKTIIVAASFLIGVAMLTIFLVRSVMTQELSFTRNEPDLAFGTELQKGVVATVDGSNKAQIRLALGPKGYGNVALNISRAQLDGNKIVIMASYNRTDVLGSPETVYKSITLDEPLKSGKYDIVVELSELSSRPDASGLSHEILSTTLLVP